MASPTDASKTPPHERQKSDGPKSGRSAKSKDLLSIVIFKDHFTPRTFHFPRFWVNNFGMLLLLASVITLASVGASFRYSYLLKNARRDYSREIEEERHAQELAREALENKNAQQKSQPAAPVEPPTPAEAEAKNKKDPTEKTATAFLGNLFGAFTTNTVRLNSDLSQSPITIEGTAVQWREKSLKVHFELHYTKDDGGNQKGRIYLLARGPDTLLSYPPGSLEPVGSPALLSEARGEQFSVSRLRMVDASFDGFANRSQIRTLEVIILSLDNELLIHQSLPLPAVASAPSGKGSAPQSETATRAQTKPKPEPPAAAKTPLPVDAPGSTPAAALSPPPVAPPTEKPSESH